MPVDRWPGAARDTGLRAPSAGTALAPSVGRHRWRP